MPIDRRLFLQATAAGALALPCFSAILAFADQDIAAAPLEKDALTGPFPIEILARVAAQMGEPRPCHCRFTETTLDTVQ